MVGLQVVTQRVVIRHFEVIGSRGQGWAGECFPEHFPFEVPGPEKGADGVYVKIPPGPPHSGTRHPLLSAPRALRTGTSPQRFATICRTLPQVWAVIPRRPSW